MLSYLWYKRDNAGNYQPFATTQNIVNLGEGDYQLAVTDPIRGCTVVKSFILSYQNVLSVNAAIQHERCAGANDGAITKVMVSGVVNPVYSWTGPNGFTATTAEITGLEPGTYVLTVFDPSNSCMVMQPFEVKPTTPILFSLSKHQVSCAPYVYQINIDGITGGVAPYKYSWNGPGAVVVDANGNATNLVKGGTYTVSVADQNGCVVTKSLTIPLEVELSAVVDQLMCAGGDNGFIDLTVTGGSGSFSYQWTKDINPTVISVNQDIDNLTSGVYKVTVTDLVEGCVKTAVYEIFEPSAIKISGALTHVSCNGSSDGKIVVTPSGGNAPYTYRWDTGITTKDLSSLSKGNYTVVVTDAKGCTANETFRIYEPDPIEFDLVVVTPVSCDGNGARVVIDNLRGGWLTENGVVVTNPITGNAVHTPMYDIVWAGPAIVNGNRGQTDLSNLTSGTYVVTITDASAGRSGCQYTKSVYLPKPLKLDYKTTPETCDGINDGTITLNVVGGVEPYNFTWTTADGFGIDVNGKDQIGLSSGTYTVTIVDSRTPGCTLTENIYVDRAYVLDVKGSATDVACFGEQTGSILINVSGGSGNYSYHWTGTGLGIVDNNKDQNSLTTGSYSVTVTDNVLGCTNTQTFYINSPAAKLEISKVDVVDVLCKGDATGVIDLTVVGGTKFNNGSYKFNWNGPGVFTDSHRQENLIAGLYNVVVTDRNGCIVSSSNIEVKEPANGLAASVDYIQDVAAFRGNDGEIQIVVSGGTGAYTIVWSGTPERADTPIGALINNATRQTNLVAGTYEVVITDLNGCSVTLANIVVRQPGSELDLVIAKKDVLPCFNDATGQIDVSVVGGRLPYIIRLHNSSGVQIGGDRSGSSALFAGLTPGVYTVSAVDANKVYVSKEVTITEPPLLTVSAAVNQQVNCYQAATGVFSVTVNGGAPSAAGNYRVIVNGPGGFSEVRSNFTLGTSQQYINLIAGVYNITVIDDSNGNGLFDINTDCSVTTTVTIVQPEAHVVLSGVDDMCIGNTSEIKFIVSNYDVKVNPLTVTLSDGSAVVVNDSPFMHSVNPVISTIYSIASVTDGAGCSKGTFAGSADITVRPLPTARVYGDKEICLGESASVAIDLTGTAPWNIEIFDGVNIVPVNNIIVSPYIYTFTPASTSVVTVDKVRDAHCSNVGNGSATITINDLPFVTISGENTICFGDKSNLVFHFSAGTAPYKISYAANGIMYHVPNIIPDASGNYSLQVQPGVTTNYDLSRVEDSKGCVVDVTGSVVVSVRPQPGVPGAISGNPLVCQGAKGVVYSISAVANATNYDWSLPAGATIVSGLGSTSITVDFDDDYVGGVFGVVAVNSCGRSNSSDRLISASELPGVAGVITGPADLCQGSAGIQYSVVPVRDASTYIWNLPVGFNIVAGAGTANIIVDLDPAIDVLNGIITVTPSNSCGLGTVSPDFAVNITPLPIAFAGHDQNLCANSFTLQADAPRSGEQGRWTIIKGSGVIAASDLNNHNATITNLSQGENILQWRVENTTTKCYTVDEVVLFNNILTVVATVEQRVVCDGTAQLEGTRVPLNSTGLWTFVSGGGIIVSPTSNKTDVVSLTPDVSVLRWTIDQNGCRSFAEVEVINDKPDDAKIIGDVYNLCDDKIELTGNTPVEGVGYWTRIKGLGIIDNPANPVINVTNLSRGENIFRYTITKNGCRTYDEVIVNNNMLDVNAGDDAVTCDDFFRMRAIAAPAGTSAHWEIALGEGSGVFEQGDSPTTMITKLGSGDNKFYWVVNKNGCISTDEVVITSNKPTTAVVGSQVTVCGDEAQLQGNDNITSGTGYWTVISGSGVFEDPYKGNTKVTSLQYGTSVFRWNIVNNGCPSYADQIVVNLKVETFAGKDTSICSNTTTLNAKPPQSGQIGEWTLIAGMGGATIVESNNPKTRVGGLSAGANGFVWTVSHNSCISRDTVIVYNSRPTPVNAGPDQILNGDVTNMSATVPTSGVGTWSLVAGGGTIVDPSNPFTQIRDLRRGDNIFRWTVRNGNCEEYDDVVITNGQTLDANAGENRTVCDDFVILNANDPDVGIGEWSVVSGSGDFVDPYNPRTRVNRIGKGVNVFRWSIYYTNSVSADEVTITNNAPDKANGGPRERVVCGDTHTMEGNIPLVGDAKWTIISGGAHFVDDTDPNTVVTNLAKGWNKFKYEINYKGCPSSDTIRVLNDMPDDAFAGDGDVVCNGQYELKPNNPTFGVGEWVVVEGRAKFDGNYATNLAQGRNVFAWIIRGSTPTCFTRDEVVVINNEPSVAYAGGDQNVCTSETRLGAAAPLNGVGRWTLIHGSGVIEDEFDRLTRVTGLALGSNRFRWTVDNNGCTSTSEVVINNNFIQSVAGIDDHITICIDTLVLAANNPSPGVGTWGVKGGSGKAVFADINDPYTVVRSLDRGDNILTWTIMHKNCPSVSEIRITNNSPSEANAGGNQSLCDKDFTMLNASKPAVGTGKWTIKSGGANIADDTANSTQITNIAFGDNIFNWRVEHKGCYSEDDVQISYNRIEAKAGDSEVICSETTQLAANNPNPGVGTWSVVGGTSQAQFENQNDPATIVKGLAKGKNRLRWTIEYRGCSTNDEIEIQNDLPSRAYAGNSLPICKDEVVLDATPVDVGVGTWTVLTGSGIIENDLNPKTKVTKLSKGDNVFRWTVVNNQCSLFDDVRITNNLPSVPYAGRSEEVCSNTFTLKANPAEFGTGIWSITKGSGNFSDPLSPNSVITNLSEGENILRWTLTQGQCSVFDEVTLLNNSAIQATAGPDIDDCKDYAVLDANNSGRGAGVWTLVSGRANFDDPNNPKTTVRNLGFGENVLQWKISNGKCFSTDEVVITNKIPDQANAGTGRTICDDYHTLNANNPTSGVGTWSVISGKGVFDDVYYNRTIVRNIGYGENIYRWTVSYGSCSTQDDVIIVNQMADPYAGEDDITYVDSYELKAGNPGSVQGKWELVAGGARFEDDTYFNTMVYDLHPGNNTFRWTIWTDDCKASDDVVIEYRQVPLAGFAVDVSEGCAPLTVRFTDQSVGAKVFHWDFNDGSTTVIRNPIHTFEQPGNYNVVLTTPGPDGKDTQFSKLIKVYDHPTADFDAAPTLVFLPDDVVRFRNFSIDAVKWSWTFGDGGESTEKNPDYKYVDEGLYTVSLKVWNQYGCEDKITKPEFIEARKGGFITFPNTFRPRPDGGGGTSQFDLNAVFKPVYQDVDQFHLQIFNRWGQLIFETDDIDEGWNGFFNGQIAPQAVYVWVATGRFISGKEYSKTGHVLLAR